MKIVNKVYEHQRTKRVGQRFERNYLIYFAVVVVVVANAVDALNVVPNGAAELGCVDVRLVGQRAVRQVVRRPELPIEQMADVVVQLVHQRESVVVPGVILDAKCAGNVLGAAAGEVLVGEERVVDEVIYALVYLGLLLLGRQLVRLSVDKREPLYCNMFGKFVRLAAEASRRRTRNALDGHTCISTDLKRWFSSDSLQSFCFCDSERRQFISASTLTGSCGCCCSVSGFVAPLLFVRNAKRRRCGGGEFSAVF